MLLWMPPSRIGERLRLKDSNYLSGVEALELIYSALVVKVVLWSQKSFSKLFFNYLSC